MQQQDEWLNHEDESHYGSRYLQYYFGNDKKGGSFIFSVAAIAIILGIVSIFLTSTGVFSPINWLASLVDLNLSSLGVTSLTSVPFAFISGLLVTIGSGVSFIAIGFLLYLGFSFLKSCIEAITSHQQIRAIDVFRKIRSFIFSAISLPISLVINMLVYPVIGLMYCWDIAISIIKEASSDAPSLGNTIVIIAALLLSLILFPITPIYYLLEGVFDACFYNAKRGVADSLKHPLKLLSGFVSETADNTNGTIINFLLLGFIFSMLISAVFAILAATHTFSILHFISQVTNFNPLTTFHLVGAPIPTLAIATFGLLSLTGTAIFITAIPIYLLLITLSADGHARILDGIYESITDPDFWRAAGRGIRDAAFWIGRGIKNVAFGVGLGLKHLFYLFKYRVLKFEPEKPEEIKRYAKVRLKEGDFNCSISIDKAETPAITPCGHIFDYARLLQWIELSENCPNCRDPVQVDQVKTLPEHWKSFFESKLPKSEEDQQQVHQAEDSEDKAGPEAEPFV